LTVSVQACVVGFEGAQGVTHSVHVEAATVYEAAARGLAALQRHPWCKSELTLTTVLLVRPVGARAAHRVDIRHLLTWFDSSGPDRARKFQLKRLLDKPQDSPRVNKRLQAY